MLYWEEALPLVPSIALHFISIGELAMSDLLPVCCWLLTVLLLSPLHHFCVLERPRLDLNRLSAPKWLTAVTLDRTRLPRHGRLGNTPPRSPGDDLASSSSSSAMAHTGVFLYQYRARHYAQRCHHSTGHRTCALFLRAHATKTARIL